MPEPPFLSLEHDIPIQAVAFACVEGLNRNGKGATGREAEI